ISDTAPTGKLPGALWWESDTGILYVFYDDGDSQQWVQAAASALDYSQFLLKSGGTLTGPLTLAAHPTTSLQAATKQYVDAVVIQNYLTGLTRSTAGGSTTFAVAPGMAADSTNAATMVLASFLTKTTAAWAQGNGVGAIDSGAAIVNAWYHVFLIKNP